MGRLVFEGLKVLDFTWVAAGPILTQSLADHGAMVVRVESATRPDILRMAPPYKDKKAGIDRSGYFARFNTDKYGVSLNLNHPRAGSVIRRLVDWCDVAVENFTPGSLKHWGWDYEELRKLKPDIIMLSTSNQGQTGPHSHHPGHGGILTSLAGFSQLTGWEDQEACQPFGALTDFITPLLGTIALIGALEFRRRTGEGQYLDLSQYESSLLTLTPVMLDWFANGHQATRMGNRSPHAAPHGAYPCQGEDKWCVVAVESEQEWLALCRALGQPFLTDDPRFTSLDKRMQNQDALDLIITDWTSQRTPQEAMDILQKIGVPAGAVQDPAEMLEDIQLKHRRHFKVLEHPEIGPQHYENPPFHLSRTPAELRMPSPCVGQHNEYIYREVLGMPDEEFVELLVDGVLV
ncbi:MAG: CoA transferase [Dehalococcoidia bacterium]|jgi:benzylsuccinate CoA-transferase BbsF subunit|nr:CoA transferase [Dehalococcoidia bacterium]MDP7469641.1 CoA transferase [Dehalococcoidia bacterium]